MQKPIEKQHQTIEKTWKNKGFCLPMPFLWLLDWPTAHPVNDHSAAGLLEGKRPPAASELKPNSQMGSLISVFQIGTHFQHPVEAFGLEKKKQLAISPRVLLHLLLRYFGLNTFSGVGIDKNDHKSLLNCSTKFSFLATKMSPNKRPNLKQKSALPAPSKKWSLFLTWNPALAKKSNQNQIKNHYQNH